MEKGIFTKAPCACGGMVEFFVNMVGRSVGARSVVGLPYVSMAGISIVARSVVGLASVSMAGISIGVRSVVGLAYVSMAGGSARSVVGLVYVSMAGESLGAGSVVGAICEHGRLMKRIQKMEILFVNSTKLIHAYKYYKK